MHGTLSRLNWRVSLVQFLANAVVIDVLIAVLPGFELHAKHELLAVLWLAAVFGVVSALLRPAPRAWLSINGHQPGGGARAVTTAA